MSKISWTPFEERVGELIDQYSVPGLAVSVARGDEVIYAKGFGVRDRNTNEKVTPDTVFGIASVTKSFTSTAIMQLADKGALKTDDPVVDLLPEFCIRDAEWLENLKVHHLMAHTSGLPPLPGLYYAMAESMKDYPRWDPEKPDQMPETGKAPRLDTFSEYLEWLSNEPVQMLGRPGEYFSYSNDGYSVLAAIIEKVSGQNYYEYMNNHILRPLNMRRSTLSLDELSRFENVTKLYYHNKNHEVLDVPRWQHIRAYDAGGGIRSTVLDLAKCGLMHANLGVSGGVQIVSDKGIRYMRDSQTLIGEQKHYGCGWMITPDYAGSTLVEHGGSLTGVGAAFGYVPEKRLSVAVLANVTRVATPDVWLCAVNTALGLPLSHQRPEESPKFDVTKEQSDRFSGSYKSGEGSEFRIYSEGDHTFIETMGRSFELKAFSDDTLVYPLWGHYQAVKFFGDEKGDVWAASSGLRMVRRVREA